MNESFISLLGGALIGLSTSLMLAFTGRVTGISGMLYGELKFPPHNLTIKKSFLLGLILGGVVISQLFPSLTATTFSQPRSLTLLGGFFVGFGALLGNGCTSGHGVCGMSRLSTRSIFATLNFIFFGALTVYIVNNILIWREIP